MRSPSDWKAPYILAPLGEYVVEIILQVEALIDLDDDDQRKIYGDFARANSPYLKLCRQRAVSYWNEYYKDRYASYKDFPSVRILDRLAELSIAD
jgi:hypothetical protein